MPTRRLQCFTLIVCIALLGSTAQARTHKKTHHSAKPTSSPHVSSASQPKGKHVRKAAGKKKHWRRRGQQAMGQERVREIQAALIRENYLQGTPTGVWDQRSKDAMVRYQSVNGWQTKVVPDSRALIKLGLGPDRANLINPDTAATFIPGGGTPATGAASPSIPQR